RGAVPAAGGGGGPAAPPLDLRRRRRDHPVPRHQADRHAPGRAGVCVARRRGGFEMGGQLRPAIVSLVFLTVLTGIVYPLVVTGIAQVVFPWQANGSLLLRDGKLVGSALIGQPFDDPRYFWSRPSATSPFAYNAGSSSGSNQGPTNPALHDAVKGRVEALRGADPGNPAPIAVDLVTASGSGLDPHISPAAAL